MTDRVVPSEEALLELRPRLVRFFSSRGRSRVADELADEVILRMLNKLRQGEPIESLVGYSLGVARLVLLEDVRGPARLHDQLEGDFRAPEATPNADDQDCLDRCLDDLPAGARTTILRFYGEGQPDAKNKDVRKQLAGELGISMDALFLRASKLRRTLRACVESCLVDRGAGGGQQETAGSITVKRGSE